MNIVKDYIFPENKLGSDQIEAIVSEASGSAIDLSDVYIQYTTYDKFSIARALTSVSQCTLPVCSVNDAGKIITSIFFSCCSLNNSGKRKS